MADLYSNSAIVGLGLLGLETTTFALTLGGRTIRTGYTLDILRGLNSASVDLVLVSD